MPTGVYKRTKENCKKPLFNKGWFKKGHTLHKGKTFEESYGEKRAKEIKLKLSLSKLGSKNPQYGGGKDTPETTLKKSINNGRYWKGKHRSKETKEKISKNNLGKIAWNKGLKMNADFCKKISIGKTGKSSYKKGKSMEELYGKERAIKIKKVISEKMSKIMIAGFKSGKYTPSITYNKSFFYNGIAFRSIWEVKVAKFLDYNNIMYEYESNNCRIVLDNCHIYVIDFYLPKYNKYIEVKGKVAEKDKCKIELAKSLLNNNFLVVNGKDIEFFNIEKYPLSVEGLNFLNSSQKLEFTFFKKDRHNINIYSLEIFTKLNEVNHS